MKYVDLETDSPSMVADDLNGLCTVCKTIDLVFLTRESCCRSDDKKCILSIGPLGYVLDKAVFCAACLLIQAIAACSSTRVNAEDSVLVRKLYLRSENRIRKIDDSNFIEGHGLPMRDSRVIQDYRALKAEDGLVEVALALHQEMVIGQIIRSQVAGPKGATQHANCDNSEAIQVVSREVPPTLSISLLKDWIRRCYGGPSRRPSSLGVSSSLQNTKCTGIAARTPGAKRFSGREFTDTGDVIWAFMGLLKLQAPRFTQGYRGSHHRVPMGKDRLFTLDFPSWSWLASSEWHKPLLIGDAIYPNPQTAEGGQSSSLPKDISDTSQLASPLFKVAQGEGILDYGLLQFTAQTAKLRFKQTSKQETKNKWVKAKAYCLWGRYIGKLTITSSFFGDKSKRVGECVLLSTNTFRYCPLNKTHNVMLIERDGDMAYRKGLGAIKKNVWARVKAKSKRMVLG
ncbi:uncharacterized protein F4812DRAFT_467958 [Daldinia caldariorum]|uniref:uncharacterized protein n=1 Tax=Daldinia caldariorum TaxID=326644 RepID=UPI002007482A|nr:uncharacterized protein F4812DRAFT_467958 [Daldinia caldariorum]KAI1464311.1 hypothetical protein F4812DRAFT_467958 [Daldinia caldariorum]